MIQDSVVNEINAIYITDDSNVRYQSPDSWLSYGRGGSDIIALSRFSWCDGINAPFRQVLEGGGMDSTVSKERRQEGQRRHCDAGPPKGMIERRINIERRLFNLSVDYGWGRGKSPASVDSTGNASAGC